MGLTNRTFRIFISSTFSDFKEERNALQTIVFPKLRELCSKHGCFFQAIDLRWGVSKESAFDQQSLRICLEEIARCQNITPKPNFILLLGNRYGWRPLPAEILATTFDKLKLGISDSKERALLDKWYQRDDNAFPAVYCLQPRITDEERDLDFWTRIENILYTILKKAFLQENCISDNINKFGLSATEHEIIHGALKVPDAKEHVFGFFRNIEGLTSKEYLKDYVDFDIHGTFDEKSWHDSEKLKKTVQEFLGENNIFHYTATLEGKKITYGHLPKFCEDVEMNLKSIILNQIKIMDNEYELDKEVDAHKVFGNERANHFIGRSDLLHQVYDYIEHGSNHPLVICGDSGSGKTALMAKIYEEAQTKFPKSVIISRFIGATPSSTDVSLLIKSISIQIYREYDANISDIQKNYSISINEFPAILQLASTDKKLIIILDALDQISATEKGSRFTWLPPILPDFVRIIVSFLPGIDESSLNWILSESQILEIEKLNCEDGTTLLESWLDDVNRTLQPLQKEEIISKFKQNGLPLYLKLAFEEACHWKSYTNTCHLGDTLQEIILNNLLKRLSLDINHGPKLVSWSLGYLAASRHGLSEYELIDLISNNNEVFEEFKKRHYDVNENVRTLPVIIWSRLYFDLEPYFMERNVRGVPLLTFYHRRLEVIINEKIVAKDSEKWHIHLANYFTSQSSDDRKVEELPWQLEKAKKWEQLKNCISDVDMFMSMDNDQKKYELMSYWKSIRNQYDLVKEYTDTLNKYITHVSQEKEAELNDRLGLFFQLCGKYSDAQSKFQRALDIRKVVLGDEDIATATSMHHLAVLFRRQSNISAAIPLMERALDIIKEKLGKDHPETAVYMSDLALIYKVGRRFPEAKQIYRDALEIKEKETIPDYLRITRIMNNQAMLLKEEGAYGEAIELLERALAIRKKHYGPDHPDTATCMKNLGILYKIQGNFTKATPLIRNALDIRINILGINHVQTAVGLNNMGKLLQAEGWFHEAIPLLKHALTIREREFGLDHPQVATYLNDLSLVLRDEGRYSEAIPLLKRALIIREKYYGPDHTKTENIRKNLTKILMLIHK